MKCKIYSLPYCIFFILCILIFGCKSQMTETDIPTTSTLKPTKTPTIPFTETVRPTATPIPTASPTPQDVPPQIIIQSPSTMVIGEQIILDASDSFDFDNDPFILTWTQIHMPDKYREKEYYTGNEVDLTQIDDFMMSFIPDMPGVYRFEVEALDDDGLSTSYIDVPVELERDRFQYRGVALEWCCNDSDITISNLKSIIHSLKPLGVNTVEIAPIGCMTDTSATEILSYPGVKKSPNTCFGSLSDELLNNIIDELHANELSVLLAPQVQGFGGEGWGQFFWTGSIQPADWEVWFTNYGQFILHYAEIAETKDVELFQIANELNSTQPKTENWEQVIASVREVYSGPIGMGITVTWHANWPRIRFWEKLDFIGFHFYLEGTGMTWPVHSSLNTPASTDPSFMDMRSHFDRTLRFALDPLIEQTGLDVIVTEMGIRNYDGANVTLFGEDDMIRDNKEQADYYEAAIQSLSSREGVVGLYCWALDWKNPTPAMITLDPRYKPAEEIIRLWYRGTIK